MNISDHINEIKKRADAATKSEWDSRLSHDIYKTPYVMIDPGYFIWPHFVDNLVTKALNKKPNFTNDIAFISHARTMTPLACKALLLAIEGLESCKAYSPKGDDTAYDALTSITSTWPDA